MLWKFKDDKGLFLRRIACFWHMEFFRRKGQLHTSKIDWITMTPNTQFKEMFVSKYRQLVIIHLIIVRHIYWSLNFCVNCLYERCHLMVVM